MIGYVPGTGWLHRSHPFAALVAVGAIVVLAIFLPGPVAPGGLAMFTIGIAFSTRAWTPARNAALMSLPFWFFLLVIHGVVGDDPGKAVVLASRLTAIIFGFTVVISTVHPARMTEALVHAGAPFGVVYLFSATLQTIPRLKDRAVGILETQQCRGLSLRGSAVRRMRNLVPLAVPLVLGALAEIDERAMALETRGAGAGRRRTALDPPAWRPFDFVAIVLSGLAGLTAVVWWWLR